MKKRSLVAALAMLMVSAIVLTSSTYAWFAASNTASVSQIEASVTNSSGSIYISTTGAANSWKTSLSSADYSGLATAMSPVSAAVNKNSISFQGGLLTATPNETTGASDLVFTTKNAISNTDYLTFDIFLYAEVACEVTITPTLDTDGLNYIYGFATVGENGIVLGTSGDSYTPIVGTATAENKVVDSGNGIIDAGECAMEGFFGDAVNVSSESTLKVTFTEDQVGEANKVKVTCYVWAEGQDADCKGTAANNVGMAVSFSK
ncbi:MAG: hypothetical protein IKK85_09885 [Clostridia bacterium]|nr:hypothetical protein [Clostridia bacterium]